MTEDQAVQVFASAVWIFIALWTGLLAGSRGSKVAGVWFLLGLVFGPFALLYAYFKA